MYYKGMWDELKNELNSINSNVRNTRKKNKKLIRKMKKLEEKYGDYEEMNRYCPKCGKPMTTRKGKYGYFRGCSGFPKCDYHEFYREFGTVKDNSEEMENINNKGEM